MSRNRRKPAALTAPSPAQATPPADGLTVNYNATTVQDAARWRTHAAASRALATVRRREGDHDAAAWNEGEATAMDAAASRILRPDTMKQGAAAEVALFTGDRPLIAAEAAGERIELAGRNTTLALDTAAAAGARDSIEAMIAHQLAATHSLAMRLSGLAEGYVSSAQAERMKDSVRYPHERSQPPWASIEAARLALAAVRCAEASQAAALTLVRLRTGGKQVMHVHQYTHVAEGGQAVVAGGDVRPRGQGRGRRRRGGE